MAEKYLPPLSENPEHFRHERPAKLPRAGPFGLPARWYRIHVDYIPMLVALCDYMVHSDAFEGTSEQREIAAARWGDLQYLLMTGTIDGSTGEMDYDDTFCARVAECIISGNIDGALTIWYEREGGIALAETITPTNPAAQIEMLYDCQPNKVYGLVIQLVDLLHRAIRDLLQQLQASVGRIQETELLIRAIPIIGSLPIDETIGMVAVLVDNFAQNYDAAYTESLKHKYYCDIFCLVLEDCSMNLHKVGTYFAAQFFSDLFTLNWEDVAELILQGVWSGSELVHVLHALAAYSLSAGFAFVGITPQLLLGLMKAFSNESDPDWQYICDPCETENHVVLNFIDAPYGFGIADGFQGAWESGEGWTLYGHPVTSSIGLGITRTLQQDSAISKILCFYTFKWGAESTVTRDHWLRATDFFTETAKQAWISGSKGKTYERSLEIFPTVETRQITATGKAGSTGGGSFVKIRRIELWFTGDIPIEFQE